jgi:hypothetical protein
MTHRSVGWIATGPRQDSHFWLQSPPHPWSKFLLSPRYAHVLKWGLLYDKGGGQPFYVGTTFVNWLINCCWPSPAQWFLVPSWLFTRFCWLTALEAFRLSLPHHWYMFNLFFHSFIHYSSYLTENSSVSISHLSLSHTCYMSGPFNLWFH